MQRPYDKKKRERKIKYLVLKLNRDGYTRLQEGFYENTSRPVNYRSGR